MKKRGLIAFLFVFSFLLGNSFSSNGVQAGESIGSLQKQVKVLTSKVKDLTKKNNDLTIQIKAKDKEIAALKSNSAKASTTKVAYKGLTKAGLIEYKNATYMPVAYVKDVLNVPVTSDHKANMLYLGTKPNGTYMSDLLKPFYSTVDVMVNEKMVMGEEIYYKGYIMKGYGSENDIAFNLGKKYKNIIGKVGFSDDSRNMSDTTIRVFGDDELLGTIEIKAGNLPVDFYFEVSNINKLTFKINTESSSHHTFNFADVVIN